MEIIKLAIKVSETSLIHEIKTSSKDGGVGKHGTHILPQPHQTDN